MLVVAAPADTVAEASDSTGGDAAAGVTGVDAAAEASVQQTADGSSTPWGWAITLIVAMVVGLLMIIQGVRALRTPTAARRPRPAPSGLDDSETDTPPYAGG